MARQVKFVSDYDLLLLKFGGDSFFHFMGTEGSFVAVKIEIAYVSIIGCVRVVTMKAKPVRWSKFNSREITGVLVAHKDGSSGIHFQVRRQQLISIKQRQWGYYVYRALYVPHRNKIMCRQPKVAT
ncbi:hypothetical protein H5410_043057 [Solanum commersonii]|uniref:Uncharacterized protein n=1 Tax=Solanum commersonii TaxID=4109 RepID=A0A9J5XY61_SOLCO|nr:hypothetical protein H5410_043057 [Solanum commersonii]